MKDYFQDQDNKAEIIEKKAKIISEFFPDLYIDSDEASIFINGTIEELVAVRKIFGGEIRENNQVLLVEIYNKEFWKNIISYMKMLAEKKGLTQNDISKITGYKQSHISRIFSMNFSPSFKNFLVVADAIGMSVQFGSVGDISIFSEKKA